MRLQFIYMNKTTVELMLTLNSCRHNTLIAERIRKSNLNQKESQGYLISKHYRVQTFGLQILVPGVIVYKIRDSSDSCPRHLRINSCLQASRVNSRKCLGLGLRLQNEIKNANMISGPWQVHLQAIKHNGTR